MKSFLKGLSRRSRRGKTTAELPVAIVVVDLGHHATNNTLGVKQGDTILRLQTLDDGELLVYFQGHVGRITPKKWEVSKTVVLVDLESSEIWQQLLENTLVASDMRILKLLVNGVQHEAMGTVSRGLIEMFRLPEVDLMRLVDFMIQKELQECSEPALFFRQDSPQSRFMSELSKALCADYVLAVANGLEQYLKEDAYDEFRSKPVLATELKKRESAVEDPSFRESPYAHLKASRKQSMIDWMNTIGDTETETETHEEILVRQSWNAQVCRSVWETADTIIKLIVSCQKHIPLQVHQMGVLMTKRAQAKFSSLTPREIVGSFLILRFVAPALSTLPDLGPSKTAHVRNAVKVVQNAVNATTFLSEDLQGLNVNIKGGTHQLDELFDKWAENGKLKLEKDKYHVRYDVDLNGGPILQFWNEIMLQLPEIARRCKEDEHKWETFKMLVEDLWGSDFVRRKYFKKVISPRSPRSRVTTVTLSDRNVPLKK